MVFSNYGVGILLLLISIGLIIYRHTIRYNAKSIEVIKIEPYSVFKATRGWGVYKYRVIYIIDKKIFESELIEFGIYISSLPKIKNNIIYKAKISKSGRITCLNIYSIEKLSAYLFFMGICALIGRTKW